MVSVITLISMAGVAVGVAALIVVVGVMDGALTLFYGQITNLYPHLRIMAGANGGDVPIDQELLARLSRIPGVVCVEPVIQKMAAVQAGPGVEARKKGIQLIGIDEKARKEFYRFTDSDTSPAARLGPGELLLGKPLLRQLKAKAGARALIITANPSQTVAGRGASSLMRIKGSFSSGFYAFDDSSAFAGPAELRRLFGMKENTADYIRIKLADPFQAQAVREEIKRTLGGELRRVIGDSCMISSWVEANSEFFSAIKIQKYGLFIILLLIILVAAFNIIGTLILMVIEKTREIGILRAVGAPRGLVARIFLLDGVIIGLVGTGVGLGLGLAICALIPVVKINMPAVIYNFDHLPVSVNPFSVTLIVVSSLAICTLAALFPARQAARLNPVEALRYD